MQPAVLLLLVAAVCAAAAPLLSAPEATVDGGMVRGAYETVFGVSLAAFRGIPFAEPPVGRQRWQPPNESVSRWTGVRDATKNAPDCINVDPDVTNTQSEDCLYVNVFTAQPDTRGKPVYVWLHGGSLIDGGSGDIAPHMAAVTPDAVVVYIAYRMGAFGFLTLPNLPASAANVGLVDMQAGLRWVQRNAGAFGGDADQVLLFGQSSGGTAILFLLASPASNGLFHAAVSMSGSPNASEPATTAQAANAASWLTATPCANVTTPSDQRDCLYGLTTAEVAAAVPASWNPPGYPITPGGYVLPGLAVVDGDVVFAPPAVAYTQPVVDVPVIITTMLDEDDASPDPVAVNRTQQELVQYWRKYFAPWGGSVGDDVAALYDTDGVTPGQQYYDLLADVGVFCGNVELALKAATGFKSNVYVGLNVHAPGKPRLQWSLTTPSTMPFHQWDIFAATRSWNNSLAPYTPTTSDAAYGDGLRANWRALLTTGSVPGWTPVQPASTHATAPVGILNATGVTTRVGFRSQYCDKLKAWGVNIPGNWWIN